MNKQQQKNACYEIFKTYYRNWWLAVSTSSEVFKREYKEKPLSYYYKKAKDASPDLTEIERLEGLHKANEEFTK